MAKNVTATLTTREGVALVFKADTEELVYREFVSFGEKFDGLEHNYFNDGTTVLKIKEIDKPVTKLYSVPNDIYMQYGVESESYKVGFLNRKFGGEKITVKYYNDELDIIEKKDYENMPLPVIKKDLKENNCTFLKIDSTVKTQERYIYMDYEVFVKIAHRYGSVTDVEEETEK